MDDDQGRARRPSPIPGHGGTVEPANRAAVAKATFQTPEERPKAHYELRDPFAEVTYRASTLPQMVAKAEQLGSQRFTAVAADGTRSAMRKVDGQWVQDSQQARTQPEQQTPAPSATQQSKAAPAKEDPAARATAPEADTGKVLQMPGRATPKSAAPDREPDPPGLARIDAQAERAALVAKLEAALRERYVVKRAPSVGDVPVGRNEYRFKGDTTRVAFTESTFKLATDTNSPSVARSMVDLAETRNWKALRVSGHEEFRRLVWFEASLRGVKAIGYEPMPSDVAWLRSEREARQVNRIEPARDASPAQKTAQPITPASEKASARGSGGRKAVLAAIEAVLVAKGVPERKRELVMQAATEKLAQRISAGEPSTVKLYDKAAPVQRQPSVPLPEAQRSRERAAPAQTR